MYVQNVNNQISIISLWVDNVLIASKPEADIIKIKTKLNSRFKMTDLGKLSWFLGIQFECKNSTIKMNQSRYIKKILSKFSMANFKPRSTPCEMDINKTSDKVDLLDSKPYHEIIGSLIYIYNGCNKTRHLLDNYWVVSRPSKIKFFPFNEGKACLTLFKRHNQSVTNI